MGTKATRSERALAVAKTPYTQNPSNDANALLATGNLLSLGISRLTVLGSARTT